MDDSKLETVIERVKRKLNVTFLDKQTEDRIGKDIIPLCIASLTDDIGITDEDFDWSGTSRECFLLVEYAFYEWNHASEQFHEDYAEDIAKIRARWEGKSIEAEVQKV